MMMSSLSLSLSISLSQSRTEGEPTAQPPRNSVSASELCGKLRHITAPGSRQIWNFRNNKKGWLKGSKFKGVAFTRSGRLEKQGSNMKGAVDVPRQWPKCPRGRCANNPRERNVFSSQAHDHSQATLYPSNGHMANKHLLPMISSLKTASGPHVFITSNGEDIRSRDWPAKPIVAEPGFFGVPPLLPVCGCLHWNGIWGSIDVRYCWVRYGAASGAELAANQEGQTALRDSGWRRTWPTHCQTHCQTIRTSKESQSSV